MKCGVTGRPELCILPQVLNNDIIKIIIDTRKIPEN